GSTPRRGRDGPDAGTSAGPPGPRRRRADNRPHFGRAQDIPVRPGPQLADDGGERCSCAVPPSPRLVAPRPTVGRSACPLTPLDSDPGPALPPADAASSSRAVPQCRRPSTRPGPVHAGASFSFPQPRTNDPFGP